MDEVQKIFLRYADSPVSFEPEDVGLYFDPQRTQENLKSRETSFEAEFLPPLGGKKEEHYCNGIDYGSFFNNLRKGKMWGMYEAKGFYAAVYENHVLQGLGRIFIDDAQILISNVIAALETQSPRNLEVTLESSFLFNLRERKNLPEGYAQLCLRKYASERNVSCVITHVTHHLKL